MHDHWLIAIALSVSALGIISLLLLLHTEPEEYNIDDIRSSQSGMPVRMRATLTNVEQRGNITVLTLEQSKTIGGVVFSQTNLTEGCVLVTGKKDTYDGEHQIIISKIQEC